jgi:S-adenosylmethionine hydrolase
VRILTFLSDFGDRSPYPAAMKGAAASVLTSAVSFVDISHDVPARDIRTGAYLLWSATPAFPAGTVHCAVVDPGVGTARAALAVASGGQWFVGPDNGLLMPAAHRLGVPTVVRLAEPPGGAASATFHGRDIFAPAAARLASGDAFDALGVPAAAAVDTRVPPGRRAGDVLEGEILWIDPFGNLITTIPGALLRDVPSASALRVSTGGAELPAVLARTFGDAPPGAAVVYVGSDGVVEVAINCGCAASTVGATAGTAVRIRPA